MTLRIENDITNNNSKPVKMVQAQLEKTPVTVPVGQTEETKPDIDQPIKGLCVEKTSEEPVPQKQNDNEQNDEELDTSIDIEDRITVHPSIAIYKETDDITNGMKEDLKKAIANSFQSSGEDAYYKASNQIKDKQPYNCFDDLKFEKKINVYGKATYERNDTKYNIFDTGADIRTIDNSAKMDLGITYKSKSEKTKAMLFTSLTKTKTVMKLLTGKREPDDTVPYENTNIESDYQQPISDDIGSEEYSNTEINEEEYIPNDINQGDYSDTGPGTDPVNPEPMPEDADQGVIPRLASNETLFCISGALRHQFNNDFGTVSAYHTSDTRYDSNTTNINASYFYNKFSALIQGEANIYKLANQKAITELDFNISLNPELANSNQKENEDNTATQEIETPKEEVVSKKSDKKWSTAFSPSFKTETTNGKTTQGLEGQLRFKRTGEDSTLRIGTYAGFSTTQQDKQYHASCGSIINYTKNLSQDKQFKAKFAAKDRYTFGGIGNILTVSTSASYRAPKLTAEVEGKYMNITHPDSPNYLGVVGRVFYTPKEYLNFFLEGNYSRIKYPDYKVGGSNVQIGAIVNL